MNLSYRIAQLFKMDKEIAQKSYDFSVSFFSKDARIQPEAVKRLIALEKEAGNIKEDVVVAQVADLSLVEEVLRQPPRAVKRLSSHVPPAKPEARSLWPVTSGSQRALRR